jgi:hypothetical protein
MNDLSKADAAYPGIVSWDRLFRFLRSKYPKLGKYGGDEGGDAQKIIAVLHDEDQLRSIAKRLFEIDIAYTVATTSAYQAIERAGKDRDAAERELLERVR